MIPHKTSLFSGLRSPTAFFRISPRLQIIHFSLLPSFPFPLQRLVDTDSF